VKPLEAEYEFEFLLVDDGSCDQSLDVARTLISTEPRLRVLELRRNYGQTAALQAGLDEAKGHIIISMDADLQHFPEEIPSFLAKIAEGNDIVCGWRHKRQEGILRRWPSQVANALIRWASGLHVHDIGTTYRAYRAEVIHDVQLLGENHRFVPVFAKMAGAKIDELKIQNIERQEGKSNYGLGRTVNVFLDLFFLHFYMHYFDRPIRIFGKLALLLFSIGSFISGVLLFISFTEGYATVREHSGWFAMAMICLISSMQLILTGILAEVLVRIYYSSKENAPYRVRRRWDCSSVTRES
jgi:glycosyltransferase involved in cell wall biosynthesis